MLTLAMGITVMYHTKAFWGLENNPNANTLNNTMNVNPTFNTLIIIIVAGILLFALTCTTRMGF